MPPFDPVPILLAIIALLLFGILCVLVLNIFTLKKKKMNSKFDPVTPATVPSTTDEIADIADVTSLPDSESDAESHPVPTEPDSTVPCNPEQEEPKTEGAGEPPLANAPPQEVLPLIKQLTKDFETKLKYDASKQELIDKLYKENMEFKEGIIKKFQRSMILAVIEKIDEAAKDIAVFENRDFSEANFRKLLASYDDIITGFQDMLSIKFDVETYHCEPLTAFDPKTQRSLKTCPTAEDDKNKLVKQTLRPGYKTVDGFILRSELVEVYVFDGKR